MAQVERYEKGLEEKTERLRVKVARILRGLCSAGFNGSAYDDVSRVENGKIIYEGMEVPDVKVTIKQEGNVSIVIADGKEAVFAEFGAGVYYNPGGSPNPLSPPGVVAIGTYGRGRGSRKVWGFYDEQGSLHLTHGTPASMPMYRAIQAVAQRLPELAREVFAGP